MNLSKIKNNEKNPRSISESNLNKLANSIKEFPEMMEKRPIVIDETNTIIGGNMRLRALQIAGYTEVPDNWIVRADNWTEEQKRQFIIKDNASYGQWDWDILNKDWDIKQLDSWAIEIPEIDFDVDKKQKGKTLEERFIIPPFSILDTRRGYWSGRKNFWLEKGIKSEEGRQEGLTFGKSAQSTSVYEVRNELRAKNGVDPSWEELTKYCEKKGVPMMNGTSIFDPVLCELAYKWFCVEGGTILDPFAGGSVRGIVAASLGYEYYGNDLSETQIIANRSNAIEVLGDGFKNMPQWSIGDSRDIDDLTNGVKADLIFSCPPYFDLEVYSDDKRDISTMSYLDFISTYNHIIHESCSLLKEDSFACFVVGDVRDKRGAYRNFVSRTIDAFINEGLVLYNEMILVNNVASLAIRVGRQFSNSRKIGKTHQNVLVFYKGNIENIKNKFNELDLSYIDNEDIDNE